MQDQKPAAKRVPAVNVPALIYKPRASTCTLTRPIETEVECAQIENTADDEGGEATLERSSTVVWAFAYKNSYKRQCVRVKWKGSELSEVDRPIQATYGHNTSGLYSAIEAANIALREAIYERKLRHVVLYTNSKYVKKCVDKHFRLWRKTGFTNAEGKPVRYREALQELDCHMSAIKVYVRYATFMNESETSSGPKGHFQAAAPKAYDIQLADTSQSTIVYTAGHSVATGSKGKYFHGAYGVHWPGKPELNKSVRITAMPTQMRCKLNAIVTALEQAVEAGVKDLVVVTDDRIIPTLYNNGWLRANGQRASNYSFYERMRQLAHKLKVRFVTTNCAQMDGSAVEEARRLAAEGLAQVRPVMQPQPKKKRWTEIYGEHLEATDGFSRSCTVHLLTSKAGSGRKKYCATFVNGCDHVFLRLTSGREARQAALASLTDVLEKAIHNQHEEIVIRTNRVDIAKALVTRLPERRDGDSLKKTVGENGGSDELSTNVTYYKKIAELMDRIKVRVEVIEDLSKTDPQVESLVKHNLKLYSMRSGSEESTVEKPSAEGTSRPSPEQDLAEAFKGDECIEPAEVPALVEALVDNPTIDLTLSGPHGACFGVFQDIDEDLRHREGMDASALRTPFIELFEEVPQHFESLIDHDWPAIHLPEPTSQMHRRDVSIG